MARTFFKCSWGGVRMWLASLSTQAGRTLAKQPYTRGEVPDVQDRGSEGIPTRCTLLFDDMIGDDRQPLDRLLDMLDQIDVQKQTGRGQMFAHPVHGTYLAMVEDFTYNVDDTGTITATASFQAVEEVGAVVLAPLGASLDDPAATVTAAAEEMRAQLADLELSSSIPDKMIATGKSWTDAITDNPIRNVLADLSQRSDELWLELDSLNLAADIALWPAMKAYVMAGDALQAAAAAASGNSVPLMTIRVGAAGSLMMLCASLYGADQAPDETARAMRLNDIPNPARLTIGMQLKMRQPQAPARRV